MKTEKIVKHLKELAKDAKSIKITQNDKYIIVEGDVDDRDYRIEQYIKRKAREMNTWWDFTTSGRKYFKFHILLKLNED